MSEKLVASFAEAWIEIPTQTVGYEVKSVASFAEAWIEIKLSEENKYKNPRRLLRGGVD